MTLDPRRHQLWQAIGLGPVWTRRGAPPAGAMAGAPEDPRAAHIAGLGWDELVAEATQCRACPLGEMRK